MSTNTPVMTDGLSLGGGGDRYTDFFPARPRYQRFWTRLKEQWIVWLIAGLTLTNGVTSLLRLLIVRFHHSPRLFNSMLPYGLHHWNRSLTVVFGFALIYLSINLYQRRQIAWLISVIISLLSILPRVGHGDDITWYAIAGPAGTAALLVVSRRRFTVRSEPRGILRGVGLFLFSLAIALAYGTIGFYMLERRDFGVDFNWDDALIQTLREFVLLGNSNLTPYTRHAHWFLQSLHILGLVAGAVGLYSLFRPLAYRLRTLPHERAIARTILEKHGRSALDYFKLWPDKSYYFSEDHRCFVAYRTAWNVAVCLGDPVGPEDCLEEFTRSFLRYCTDNGWTVSFHQVPPYLIPMYRNFGLGILKIGETALVDLKKFCEDTSRDKHFRHARNRFERDGFTLTRHVPPHPPELIESLKEVSDEWLSLPGRRERGFTLGQFRHDYVNEMPLFVLRSASGRIEAFVNEIPVYHAGDCSIDMMRHRVDLPNGAMDYVFQGLLLNLYEAGYKRFDLGMAPFTGVGDRPGATFEERAIHQLFERLNRFFSFKGLRNYKSKFDPEWEAAFEVYQGGPPGLLRTALAITRVTEEEAATPRLAQVNKLGR